MLADDRVPDTVKTSLTGQYQQLNPAGLRRDILDLAHRLLELVTAKQAAARLPASSTAAPRRVAS